MASETHTIPADAPRRFQEMLESAERITLITHIDMDGMAAAKLLLDSRFGPKFQKVYFTDSAERDLRPHEVEEAEKDGSDLVLVTDLSPHNYAQMNRLIDGRRGAIVDHHRPKDYAQIKNFETAFLTYNLVPGDPDRFSTTLTVAKLLEDTRNSEFVIAALIGDKNFDGFAKEFGAEPELVEDARFLGALYKRMGWMTPLDESREALATTIRELLFERLKAANTAKDLRRQLMSTAEIADTFAAVEQDKKRLLDAACEFVAANSDAAGVAIEFVPRSGFVLAGFIYEFEDALATRCPDFGGFCNVAQLTPNHWQLDGCALDQTRYDAGRIFGDAGVGGGHSNAGGGRLEAGDDPFEWLKAQRGFAGAKVLAHKID